MKNKLFTAGMLVMVLILGMVVVGCGEEPTDDKEIDPKLIGKWEWQTFISQGVEYDIPYEGAIKSGGYKFTSNSFTSYFNGEIAVSYQGMYTENHTLYAQNGQAGYKYSISGQTLTAYAANGSSGVIAMKVSKFSWEE